VDDEPYVLDGLRRHLRRQWDVVATTQPHEALDLLAVNASDPFAVILSDMRMPLMSGVALLEQAQRISPDTTRVLLTGDPDVQGALAAINECHVFRLMLKPCDPEQLQATIAAAAEQHRLVRGLLEPLGTKGPDAPGTLPQAVTADLPQLADSILARVPGLEEAVREIARHQQPPAEPAPAETPSRGSDPARLLEAVLRAGISRSMEQTTPRRLSPTGSDEDGRRR
jgi:DNA-binding NtrC family response regulator